MFDFTGKAFLFGDDINTDYIISSRRKRDTLDLSLLRQFIMEDIRPSFFAELKGEPGIIVAGKNFGCGSAMEVAAQILPANEIKVVLANSFARSFFRNCVNNGVLAIEISSHDISEGDSLRIIMQTDYIEIQNRSRGKSIRHPSPGGEVRRIIELGGLVNYFREP